MYTLELTFDRETDGRWIAEVEDIPGALVYGADKEEAKRRVQALALPALAQRVEDGEFSGLKPEDL